MKTSTVTTPSPFVMVDWVPLKDRFELSLIFMVAAAVGQVVLTSRGFVLTAEFLVSMVSGVAFAMLWMIPRMTVRNAARTLVLGFVWSALSLSIEQQVESVMTAPVHYQEAYPR